MIRFSSLFLLTFLLVGCGSTETDGPPKLELGRDECAHCGMIISDARYAAAIIATVEGSRRPLLFDDIGDLLDYEHDHPELSIQHRYVHDHATRKWLVADEARFVHAPTLHTPMGSGIAAFASVDQQREATTSMQGRSVELAELRQIRAIAIAAEKKQ